MPAPREPQAVTVARAHVEAWTHHDYDMTGLIQFAQAVVPGSARIIASTGDDRNALIMLTVQADFGTGQVTLPGSRLYLLDDDSKIKSEHVVFYAAG